MHAVETRKATSLVPTGCGDAAMPAGNERLRDFSFTDPRNALTIGHDRVVDSPLSPAGEFYTEALMWPVAMIGTEIAVKCGSYVDVMTMPAELGKRVNQMLRIQFMRPTIMAVLPPSEVAAASWAFFCETRKQKSASSATSDLPDLGVEHFGVGALVPLPPSPTCHGPFLQWIVPPPVGAVNRTLPPWSAVVACLRKAVHMPSSL